MSYEIRAWLNRNGSPHLQFIDAESGIIQLDWDACTPHSRSIKSLFRELILLNIRDNLCNEAARGDMVPAGTGLLRDRSSVQSKKPSTYSHFYGITETGS